jgi:hypothetical protein
LPDAKESPFEIEGEVKFWHDVIPANKIRAKVHICKKEDKLYEYKNYWIGHTSILTQKGSEFIWRK